MNTTVTKFRAWDGKRMTTSGIMFNSTTGEVETAANMPLMQFTGLKDKNGVDIYEGDILTYRPYHNLGHLKILHTAIVAYGETNDSDGWSSMKHYEYTVGGCSLADVADSDFTDESYCEVIGNIYENPELLESDNA